MSARGIKAPFKPDWRAIQSSAEAGVLMTKLAGRFRVTAPAIRQRAKREGWATPQRVLKKAGELASRNVTRGAGAVTLAAESLLSDGNTATAHAMRILLHKLAKASAKPESVADLADVGDVVTAMKGARIAGGLDREGINLTTNLNLGAFWDAPGMGSGPVEGPIVVEFEESGRRSLMPSQENSQP